MDAVFPGKIALHKLNWHARTYDDRLKNLKLLDKAMRECGITRALNAEKVAGGSFPENLAALQFFNSFVQRNCPSAHLEYHALERRLDAMGGSGESGEPDAVRQLSTAAFSPAKGIGGLRALRDEMSQQQDNAPASGGSPARLGARLPRRASVARRYARVQSDSDEDSGACLLACITPPPLRPCRNRPSRVTMHACMHVKGKGLELLGIRGNGDGWTRGVGERDGWGGEGWS